MGRFLSVNSNKRSIYGQKKKSCVQLLYLMTQQCPQQIIYKAPVLMSNFSWTHFTKHAQENYCPKHDFGIKQSSKHVSQNRLKSQILPDYRQLFSISPQISGSALSDSYFGLSFGSSSSTTFRKPCAKLSTDLYSRSDKDMQQRTRRALYTKIHQ